MPKKPTPEQIFLAWCKKAKISPKPRPISNFDIGPSPSGREYVLDPFIKVLAGKQQLRIRPKSAWFTVRFKEDGAWAGGAMLIWGKNPWERSK